MFPMRVITLVLLYYTLKNTADRYIDKSKNAAIIENWLQKTLSVLKKQCEDKNENHLEEKLRYYNKALINITSLNYKKNHTSGYYHDMVVNLWEKMLEFVSYAVQNCSEEDGFHWNVNDKFYLMSKLFREIAKRMSSVNHLTDEDYECLERMSPEIWACKLNLELRSEEPLFSTLLGELKPSFGRCDENLEVKKCVLGAYKNCSKRFISIYKMMLSPPEFGLACKNLENL